MTRGKIIGEFLPFDSLQIIKVPLPFKTRYTCLNASLILGQKYIVSNAVIISKASFPKGSFIYITLQDFTTLIFYFRLIDFWGFYDTNF